MRVVIGAALYYAERLGWPIFPANPKTKRPLIKTGRDHAEHASRDPAQIREWFERRFPSAAIAMPTGAASGVVVVDADRKHDGERVLVGLEARHGTLPRNMVVRTQSGGIHVYTRHPGGGARIKSCVGGESSPWAEHGVDVRADGGIVLLPPSPGYVWESALGEFAPLPSGWIDALRGAPRRILPAVDVGPVVYCGDVDVPECIEALRSLRRKYRESTRDGDAERADLIDRLIDGRALAEIGSRDDAVSRTGYLVGCTLPDIGPEAAEFLACRSLLAIPVPVGDREDHHHWTRKFRSSYEAGALYRREQHERSRLLWLRIGLAGGRS